MNNMDNFLARYLFPALAVGFSVISVYAQIYVLNICFGILIALLAAVVFETLRLGLLYLFTRKKDQLTTAKKIFLGCSYLLVACVCMIVAMHSLHTQIIENYYNDTAERRIIIERLTNQVRNGYAKQVTEKLDEFEQNIVFDERKLAENPNSNYWQARINQWIKKRDDLIRERDDFLSQIPKVDLEKMTDWLVVNAPKYGVTIPPGEVTFKKADFFTEAIHEIWGVSPEKAKKIFAMIYAFMIEAGIGLLAFFSVTLLKYTKIGPSDPVTNRLYQKVIELKELFSSTVQKNAKITLIPYYKENGGFPPPRDLTPNMRSVVEFIKENIESENIGKFNEIWASVN